MRFETIDLGRNYSGKIKDFAEVRNSFLGNGWVLFLDSDEEAPRKLLEYIENLNPRFPYFWVRRINLYRGRYMPAWNPDWKPALVSGKVRFYGRVHERVRPKNPHGIIDLPIIHDHDGIDGNYRNYWYQDLPVYRLWLASKKIIEVARGR